ncbi:MAG: alpha/beta hydrolase [Saprospiraceae bacterium]|nr:alpha/beta hydrolase [Saprospiraceae bacterium]
MKTKFQTLLVTGIIILFQHLVIAQTAPNQHFLSSLGMVDSLYSEVLKEFREIYVQLPRDYNPESDQKYPVVFLLDGEVFLPAVCTVHDFYSGGFMPEMVIVGISNSTNRLRDLTTSTVKTMYGMPFTQTNGEAANFVRFIEKELIPFVEKKYPVTNYRTLIGHSYGGLFSIYTLLNYPHLFANFLAIDPSLDWDDQKLLKESVDKLATKSYKGKSLFMSLSGQLHMQNYAITIDNVMQDTSDYTLFARSNIAFSNQVQENPENGLRFAWKFYPNDLHGTIPLPSIMDGLLSIFEWFQWENTDRINSPDTPTEELLRIIKYREKKLENHFGYPAAPYPEELLNMSGYMNMDMQQTEKAKMYFDLTIEYFPNSANAYDSLADYYEAKKDYVNALKSVTKAFELSGDEYYKDRMKELAIKKEE